jgi:hypothetical protein
MELGRLLPKRPIRDEQDPFRTDLTGIQVEPPKALSVNLEFLVNPEELMLGSQAGRENLPPLTGHLAVESAADPDSTSSN